MVTVRAWHRQHNRWWRHRYSPILEFPPPGLEPGPSAIATDAAPALPFVVLNSSHNQSARKLAPIGNHIFEYVIIFLDTYGE